MKNQKRIDLCLSVKFGMSLAAILRKLDHLRSNIESSLMMHNLYEHFSPETNGEYFDRNKTSLVVNLHDQINEINKLIKFNNKFISYIGLDKKISLLKWNNFKEVINERLKNKFKDGKSQELANENLRLKLQQIIQVTQKTFSDFIFYLEEERKFVGKKKISTGYIDGVEESIDLFTCGFYNSSVFIMGKTIEAVINDLLEKQMKLDKIKKVDLKEMKYVDKIGKLKGLKLIDEKLYLDLNVVRIDRNDIGHPSKMDFSRNENMITISKGLLLIEKLQKKL